MKVFIHVVNIILHKNQYKDLLVWLRDNNHELRKTMEFGTNSHRTGSDYINQQVRFLDKNAAMMFKLAWGGC